MSRGRVRNPESLRQQVLGRLMHHPRTVPELAMLMGRDRKSIRNSVDSLHSAGLIVAQPKVSRMSPTVYAPAIDRARPRQWFEV